MRPKVSIWLRNSPISATAQPLPVPRDSDAMMTGKATNVNFQFQVRITSVILSRTYTAIRIAV